MHVYLIFWSLKTIATFYDIKDVFFVKKSF